MHVDLCFSVRWFTNDIFVDVLTRPIPHKFNSLSLIHEKYLFPCHMLSIISNIFLFNCENFFLKKCLSIIPHFLASSAFFVQKIFLGLIKYRIENIIDGTCIWFGMIAPLYLITILICQVKRYKRLENKHNRNIKWPIKSLCSALPNPYNPNTGHVLKKKITYRVKNAA